MTFPSVLIKDFPASIDTGYHLVKLNSKLPGIGENIEDHKTDLTILLGVQQNSTKIQKVFDDYRIQKLTDLSPGPEGFLLKKIDEDLGKAENAVIVNCALVKLRKRRGVRPSLMAGLY